jgi:hypothetical protein
LAAAAAALRLRSGHGDESTAAAAELLRAVSETPEAVLERAPWLRASCRDASRALLEDGGDQALGGHKKRRRRQQQQQQPEDTAADADADAAALSSPAGDLLGWSSTDDEYDDDDEDDSNKDDGDAPMPDDRGGDGQTTAASAASGSDKPMEEAAVTAGAAAATTAPPAPPTTALKGQRTTQQDDEEEEQADRDLGALEAALECLEQGGAPGAAVEAAAAAGRGSRPEQDLMPLLPSSSSQPRPGAAAALSVSQQLRRALVAVAACLPASREGRRRPLLALQQPPPPVDARAARALATRLGALPGDASEALLAIALDQDGEDGADSAAAVAALRLLALPQALRLSSAPPAALLRRLAHAARRWPADDVHSAVLAPLLLLTLPRRRSQLSSTGPSEPLGAAQAQMLARVCKDGGTAVGSLVLLTLADAAGGGGGGGGGGQAQRQEDEEDDDDDELAGWTEQHAVVAHGVLDAHRAAPHALDPRALSALARALPRLVVAGSADEAAVVVAGPMVRSVRFARVLQVLAGSYAGALALPDLRRLHRAAAATNTFLTRGVEAAAAAALAAAGGGCGGGGGAAAAMD